MKKSANQYNKNNYHQNMNNSRRQPPQQLQQSVVSSNNNNQTMDRINNTNNMNTNSATNGSNSQKPSIIVHQRLRYPPARNELSKYYSIRNAVDDEQMADVIFPTMRLAFIIVSIDHIHFPNENNKEHGVASNTVNNQRKATIEELVSIGSFFERPFVICMISNPTMLGRFTELQNIFTSKVVERQTVREIYVENSKKENKKVVVKDDTFPPTLFRPPQLLLCSSVSGMMNCIQELTKIESRKSRVKQTEQEMLEAPQFAQQVAEQIFTNSEIGHGLSSYETSILLQGMGSVSNVILSQNYQEIINKTPLESRKAKLVFEYFNQ